MKKKWIGFVILVVLFACNNNNDKTKDVESAPNLTNVENVNGNVPDTNNSIVLDNKQTTSRDSLTTADTINRKP